MAAPVAAPPQNPAALPDTVPIIGNVTVPTAAPATPPVRAPPTVPNPHLSHPPPSTLKRVSLSKTSNLWIGYN